MKQKKTAKPAKLHLRRGDKVQVISGKSKNDVGKILRIDAKKMFVYVEGVNLQKKHLKPTKANQSGGIIDKEGPIHYSNLLLFCPDSNRGERIRVVKEGDSTRRMFVKSGSYAE